MKALKAERSEEFKGSFCTIIDTPCNSGAKKKTKVNPFFLFNNGFLYNQRARDPSSQTRCLKITEKVSFNITSEVSYVYILSGQKLIKNAKNGPFWQVFENQKVAVKQSYQIGQF